MVAPEDVNFHPPKSGDFRWAETNFFGFYIPERRICGCVYLIARQGLGVAMAEVTIFDRLSLERRDCLHVDSRQHLPAPADLSNYSLENGLTVRVTKAPGEYEIRYAGDNGVALDLAFKSIMEPHELRRKSPAGSDAGESRYEAGMYKGHFDLSGRVTGILTIGGQAIPVDCIDTMDHSWGPREEDGRGIPGGCWMNAQFEPDYVLHALFLFDPDEQSDQQYKFSHGYVLDQGTLHDLSGMTMQALRVGELGVTFMIHATDETGKTHKMTGSALSATTVPWYNQMHIIYALYQWITQDGRIGYGCLMEGSMMPTLTARNRPLVPAAKVAGTDMLA